VIRSLETQQLNRLESELLRLELESMSEQKIGPDEIIKFLDDQSDFTLEMKVFSHTKSQRFQKVEHGGTYEDPATQLPRQFDIRAQAYSDLGRNRCIKLAVECKALSEKFPLVIQRVPRLYNESYHEIYHAHTEDYFREIDLRTGIHEPSGRIARRLRTQSESMLYRSNEFVGKSSNQIGWKRNTNELIANDKEVYNKWAQAIASAHELIFECRKDRSLRNKIEVYNIILPILVVPDNCLWIVDYDTEGTRIADPTTCEHTSIYIGKQHKGSGVSLGGWQYTLSHLEVMTLSGYKDFTKKIASNGDFWDDIFQIESLSEIK